MMKHLIPWKKKSDRLDRTEDFGSPVGQLQHRMNDLFDEFFEDVDSEPGWLGGLGGLRKSSKALSARFEVSETDDVVQVKAELPGMDEKDVEILLDGNLLTIRGEKKDERSENKRDYYLSEVSYGQFNRTVVLPEGIDQEKAKATFKKGVLALKLPKTEQSKAKRKRIAIDSE